MFGKFVTTFGEENLVVMNTSSEKYYVNDTMVDGFIEVIGDQIYHFGKYKIEKNGWVKDSQNISHYFIHGICAEGWNLVDDNMYFFEDDGVCLTGYQSIDGENYFFDHVGRLQYGERVIGQDVYMFDLIDGHLLRDTWYKHDGLVQYVDLNGRLIVSSFYDLNGNRYYFDERGNKCVSDWIVLNHDRYYVNHNGCVVTGSQLINDILYYFDSDGCLYRNQELVTEEGTRYVQSDGTMLRNAWHNDVYYNDNGLAIEIDDVPVLELDAHGFFDGSLGNMGRLYIPSVDVDVALYYAGPYDWNAQNICDAPDSAAYMPAEWDANGGWGDVIGDHWNQGFDAIKSCQVGMKAYIVTSDRIRVYECVGIDFDGHNTEVTCIDSYGRSLWQISDLVMYTCNEHWSHITCVFWNQIV